MNWVKINKWCKQLLPLVSFMPNTINLKAHKMGFERTEIRLMHVHWTLLYRFLYTCSERHLNPRPCTFGWRSDHATIVPSLLRPILNPEVVVIKKLRAANLCYAELKLSDWLCQVVWLLLTNQSALFQHSLASLFLNMFMTSAAGNSQFSRLEITVRSA